MLYSPPVSSGHPVTVAMTLVFSAQGHLRMLDKYSGQHDGSHSSLGIVAGSTSQMSPISHGCGRLGLSDNSSASYKGSR